MRLNCVRWLFLVFAFLFVFILQSIAIAENEAAFPSLGVDGIMYDKDDPIAVVNNQLLRKGESIGGAKIIEITETEVVFQYNGKILTKSVGEGQDIGISPKKYFKKSKIDFSNIPAIKNIKSRKEMEEFVINFIIKFWRVLLLLFLAAYIYMSAMVHIIANRTGTGNGWLAWVPIVNIFLLCMIAGRSFFWVILFLIPFGPVIFLIIVWTGIAESCGKSWWWGVLSIFPILNFILAGYLAFSKISDEA